MADVFNTLNNVGNGDLTAVVPQSSGLLNYLPNIIFGVIILGGIFFALYVFLIYKEKIPVIKITRNGLIPKSIRVKRLKEKNGVDFRYKILFKNKKIPITSSPDQIYIEDVKGNFIPSKINQYDKLVSIDTTDIDFWLTNEIRESDKIYNNESFWEKNKQIIISMILITFSLVAIILILEKMKDITAGLNAVADAFRNGQIILSVPAGK